jgi:hypothetical protein
MPEHDSLMRIFWPLDIPRSNSPGIIVGWRNSGLDVFVVAILEDVDVSCEVDIGEAQLTSSRRAAWRTL